MKTVIKYLKKELEDCKDDVLCHEMSLKNDRFKEYIKSDILKKKKTIILEFETAIKILSEKA